MTVATCIIFFFFFSSRRRHTRLSGDWSQTCALPIYARVSLAGKCPRARERHKKGLRARSNLSGLAGAFACRTPAACGGNGRRRRQIVLRAVAVAGNHGRACPPETGTGRIVLCVFPDGAGATPSVARSGEDRRQPAPSG